MSSIVIIYNWIRKYKEDGYNVINHKKVKRLIKKMRLFGITIRRKRKYSSYQGNVGKIKPNLISRNFLATLPDRKCYSDITEFHLKGWQYQHPAFQNWLKNHGIEQSMSRKSNSLDNGLMEGFFGILK